MALRNKAFGPAQEFVWALDSSEYAIRENSSCIKLFKNFKEKKVFKPEYGAEGIFGGYLLGVKSVSGLAFYDWETQELVRRIEISPKAVFWSENGELVCIATEESYFVLKYNEATVNAAKETKESLTEDGYEEAFDVLGENQEIVKTGIWVGDCFIYTNSVNRLNYYVGGEIVTISHLDRTMYLLGYIPKDNRLILTDKELNVVSYALLVSVLEYQTAVMRRDFETADKVLPTIPKDQRTRVAHFLEKQGFKQQALAVSSDHEHRFDLAVQLGDLKIAYQIAKESDSEQKWKQLAELAINKCDFTLAQEALHNANDMGGLLLLATSAGNAEMIEKLAATAEASGKNNVSFTSYFILGKLEKCLDILVNTERIPEAAFFARTYLPSQVPKILTLWKEQLGKVSEKAAQSLADPIQYENLFPEYKESLKAEQYAVPQRRNLPPATAYGKIPALIERNVVEEMRAAEGQGKFRYVPNEAVNSNDILAEEKEKPIVPPPRNEPLFSSAPKAMPPPMIPSAAPLTPTPAAPQAVPPKATPPAQKPPSMLPDEFLDPELDLELEGMNLDGDDEDVNFDEDLLGDD